MSHTSPLVVGYPRTGFTLLISVIVEIFNHARIVKTGHKTIKAFCDSAGIQIAANIEKVFERHGITNDLIYNENFRQMVGGSHFTHANKCMGCVEYVVGWGTLNRYREPAVRQCNVECCNPRLLSRSSDVSIFILNC